MKLSLFILTVALAACSTQTGDNKQVSQQGTAGAPAADVAAIRTAIDAANANFGRLLSTGHADSLKTLYASDAVGLYAGTPPRVGPDSIGAYWVAVEKMGAIKAALTTADLTITDKGVVERGTYAVDVTPKGGKTMSDRGNYVVFWVQENGQWKLKYDIAVTELPPPK
jgi:ketosteroid isomerase-like protein